MTAWHRSVQEIVDEIDASIKREDDEALTLKALADRMGYSEYHMSRRFSEISGMQFREYLRMRRLAFAHLGSPSPHGARGPPDARGGRGNGYRRQDGGSP